MFAYHVHERYKLIVAANRDEFYKRPTLPVHYWEDYPSVLAGRDLHKMGTWMGVTKTGRFAALTNYRNPEEITDGKRSRGELVADFLKDNNPPEDFMHELAKKRNMYPGYNLLAGDADELYYYSNMENTVHKLEPGVYGLSNHLLNSDWPKVSRGKDGLANIISESHGDLAERVLSLLQTADSVSDELLPDTGISLIWERILSPIFIESDGYGTRSSTVLLMTGEEMYYKERVYSKEGMNDQHYTITLLG
ncbi:NRDE family protein [Paenibacillus sp. PvP091]|uniref:NRDE family protein n=1 Tax=Paenibacillus sp. PvP091 TaxID=2806590 RepID=UPI001FD77AB2|nr:MULTISPECIES: NRDE family protein [unclassified Paenibacillus]